VTLDATDDGLLLEQMMDELVGRHDRRAQLGQEGRGGGFARADAAGHAEARIRCAFIASPSVVVAAGRSCGPPPPRWVRRPS